MKQRSKFLIRRCIYGIRSQLCRRCIRLVSVLGIFQPIVLCMGCILLVNGCKKFIEIDAPITSIATSNVYTSDATAASVMTGLYANFSSLTIDYTNPSFVTMYLYPALSADELTLFNLNDESYSGFYSNNLTPFSLNYWNNLYSAIFVANSAIEGLTNSTSLSSNVKRQLLGEAKFMRAFCYFYLTNLYGDVPLAITSDYRVNSVLRRSPKADVYQHIVEDLKESENLLSDNYLQPDALTAYEVGEVQRLRPTMWAAAALLARVFLYIGDNAGAETQATAVINNVSLFGLGALKDVFKMNSSETIWSLQPVFSATNANTGDGALFILPTTGPNTFPNVVYLNNAVVNSFEIGDQRRADWIGTVEADGNTYYFPYKYKIGAEDVTTGEYIVVLRLAEQYLIRAEARVQQNNIAGAQSDLNQIRTRAGLSVTPAGDKKSLLAAIMHERQVELFTEWGHRWFDLKRTNTVDAVMTDIAPGKGGVWSSYKALYPIPQSEINTNPNLVQNTGY